MRRTLSKARQLTSIGTNYVNPGRRTGRIAAVSIRAVSIGAALAVAGLTVVAVPTHAAAKPDSFARTYLIANKASYHATLTDPTLTNAWGLAAGPGTPIWVSDNGSVMAGIHTRRVNGSQG